MACTIIKPKDRAAWLKEREAGIGSSEVATILGVNPWDTPLQLWRRKMHLDPPKAENNAMLMGHLLENAVAERWEIETGNTIIKASQGDWMMVDNDRPYLRVSPDRTFWLPGMAHNAKNKGIVEIKTTQLDIDQDNPPQYWFCQLQYQLGVAGYHQGALAWLKMGRDFGTKSIDFDPEFYAWMVEEIDRFWIDNIQGKKEPEPLNVADIMITNPRHTAGKTIEATQEIIEAVYELKSIKDKETAIKSEKAALEDKIKMYLGDAEAVTSQGLTLATWKNAKDTTKFNEKAFAAEHADMHAQYMQSVAGSRRFLIK